MPSWAQLGIALAPLVTTQTAVPSPGFTTGPTQHTTQPPAPATSFTTGSSTTTQRYPTQTFPTATSPTTFSPAPLPPGAIGFTPVGIPPAFLAKRGVYVGNLFIPLPDTPPPPGPPRDVYLPIAADALDTLDADLDRLRNRAFQSNLDGRDAILMEIRELQSVVMNTRHRLGSLRTVVPESWPEARAELDAILTYVRGRIGVLSAALGG